MEVEGQLGIPGLSLGNDSAQPPCISGTQGSCSPIRWAARVWLCSGHTAAPVRAAEGRWEGRVWPPARDPHHMRAQAHLHGGQAVQEPTTRKGVCLGVCCGGGGSFEPTQSLVLRHHILAGWASCSRCILAPESPGRRLGIWPHILQIQGEIRQRFPPYPLTLEEGSHLIGQPSNSPTQGGLGWGMTLPAGFGATHPVGPS